MSSADDATEAQELLEALKLQAPETAASESEDEEAAAAVAASGGAAPAAKAAKKRKKKKGKAAASAAPLPALSAELAAADVALPEDGSALDASAFNVCSVVIALLFFCEAQSVPVCFVASQRNLTA
jgi:hypothetical protein